MFTFSGEKWETHGELGEMGEGEAKHKMLHVGRKPGMSGPLWPVHSRFLLFLLVQPKTSRMTFKVVPSAGQ